MIKAGWPMDKVIKKLDEISDKANGFYTLSELKYLVHGGRISHLKGLLASLLKIKPIIGIDKTTGKYETFGQEITLKRAVDKMLAVIEDMYGASSEMRVQLLHGHNPEGVAFLKQKISERFTCKFEPTVPIAPVLGAHTGPSMIGLCVAPMSLFADLP
jgi:DegV family protein with EDD domain